MKEPIEKPAPHSSLVAPSPLSDSSAPAERRDNVHVHPRANWAHTRPRDWRAVKWLTVGIGVKRWVLGTLIGLLLSVAGTALATTYVAVDLAFALMYWLHDMTGYLLDPVMLGVVLLTFGVLLVGICLRGTLRSVESAFVSSPHARADFLETRIQQRRLQHGDRIVALGGGTGLSTMLRGLKQYSSNITAVVTMADDGGSSGMLRDHGMLPPGDLRNCIAALAEAEPTMTALFQHRFQGLGPLEGHSLGNLIVAALCEMTGNFDAAVQEASKVLAIRGQVLPSTLEDIRLGARLQNGEEVLGQVRVNKSQHIQQVFLVPDAPRALPGAVEAIREADIIIIGPGSLYTSIIPNLLVPEIAEAIKKSKAPKIYVCNVMTQPNETAGYTASDHVKAIIRHIGTGVLTHALINTGRVSEEVLDRYRKTGAQYVEPDEDAITMLGVRPLHANFINDDNLVRHNAHKLAATIFRLAGKL